MSQSGRRSSLQGEPRNKTLADISAVEASSCRPKSVGDIEPGKKKGAISCCWFF